MNMVILPGIFLVLWLLQADIVGGLSAVAEYGLAGICALLIIVLYKLMTDFRKSLDSQTEAMRELSVALGKMDGKMETMIELLRRRSL